MAKRAKKQQKSDPAEQLWANLDNIDVIQNIRSALQSSWGVTAHFTDYRGWIVNVAPGRILDAHNPVCEAIVRTEQGYQERRKMVLKLTAESEDSSESIRLFRCPTGVSIALIPIHLEDKFIGNVYVDGFLSAEGLIEQTQAIDTYLSRVVPDQVNALRPALANMKIVDERDLSLLHQLIQVIIEQLVGKPTGRSQKKPSPVREAYYGIFGQADSMKSLYKFIEQLRATETTVLINGESGSGKELVAKAIHETSERNSKPFLAVNCGAFNDNLLESALFGHLKGAFTGATTDKTGLLEEASEGTLFLDEVGEMPLTMQVKLLRVLQEGTFIPLGSNEERKTNARMICATHRNLPAMVKKGTFREDLYYRLNVIHLEVPPLRERKDDIEELCNVFLAKHARAEHAPVGLGTDALDLLKSYAWPGNVRELENEMQRLLVFVAGDSIEPNDLSEKIQSSAKPKARGKQAKQLKPAEQSEQAQIIDGLDRLQGNKAALAKEMGISRTSLNQKIRKLGIKAS